MIKALTKEELITLGVSDVKEDGTIINIVGEVIKQSIVRGPIRKYTGKRSDYYCVAFPDYTKKRTNPDRPNWWTYDVRVIPVQRIVYAWFYGEVPENYDVDHINNDSLDNRLENLQLLTRKENLKKRQGFKNQYQAMRPDVNWKERKERIENLKREVKMSHANVKHLRELLKTCRQEWHDAEKGVKKILAHHNLELCKLDLENAKKVWHELVEQLKDAKEN